MAAFLMEVRHSVIPLFWMLTEPTRGAVSFIPRMAQELLDIIEEM